MPKVTFEYSLKPALNALAYLQQRLPGITRLDAFKLLYLADRRHLELYGRPISGDKYVAMDNGPVPSRAYDYVLKKVGKGRELPDLGVPDLNQFSDSEQEVLDEIIKRHGNQGTSHLLRVTHDGIWRQALDAAKAKGKGSGPIPWEQIIQSLDNGEEVIEALLKD